MNLCTNAAHAMRRKGGSISIDLADFSFSSPDDAPDPTMSPGLYARLSVQDTGVGMSPETIEHIFDPFFTTKAAGRGDGARPFRGSRYRREPWRHDHRVKRAGQGFDPLPSIFPSLLEERAPDSGRRGRLNSPGARKDTLRRR